jgi:hypothetical protein
MTEINLNALARDLIKVKEQLKKKRTKLDEVYFEFLDIRDRRPALMKQSKFMPHASPALIQAMKEAMAEKKLLLERVVELKLFDLKSHHLQHGAGTYKSEEQIYVLSWLGFTDLGLGIMGITGLDGTSDYFKVSWVKETT